MTSRTWRWLLSLAILWGGSFFFAKVAVGELPPLTVVFGRVALAAVALNLVLAVSGHGLFRTGSPWPPFFTMGVLNNLLPFALIFWAQTHIASGLASILNATTPLFTALVAHFATDDEQLSGRKISAVLIGFVGVAVLLGPGLDAISRSDLGSELACLGAALSYAVAGIYGRRFKRRGVGPIDAAAGQLTASTILILPIMLAVDRPWTFAAAPSATACAALVALALLSTAVAYVLYFRILAVAGATNLLLVTLLIPVAAILLGAGFLGEHLEPRHFAGMGLIGAGLAVIDGRLAVLLRRAK